MYKITNYSRTKARKLGVAIKPSTNAKKKIDVYKDNKKVASIGAIGYNDYPTYLKKDEKLAETKRKAYKARHSNNRNVPNTAGFYADKILW